MLTVYGVRTNRRCSRKIYKGINCTSRSTDLKTEDVLVQPIRELPLPNILYQVQAQKRESKNRTPPPPHHFSGEVKSMYCIWNRPAAVLLPTTALTAAGRSDSYPHHPSDSSLACTQEEKAGTPISSLPNPSLWILGNMGGGGAQCAGGMLLVDEEIDMQRVLQG